MEIVKQHPAKQKDNLNRSMVTLYDSIKDIELKVMINEKVEVARRSATKQCNNDHRQKLRTLLTSAGKEIPPTLHRSAKSSLSLQSGLISNLSILNETNSFHTPINSEAPLPQDTSIMNKQPGHTSTPVRLVPQVDQTEATVPNKVQIKHRKFVERNRFIRQVK